MNMFKPVTAKNIDGYLAAIEEPRKSEIIKLHELIQQTVPELKPNWTFNMIGYGMFHYKYASGREGDWPMISLASQKNYISLYINAADDQGYIAERYQDRLPKANIGKSCIRFKSLADVDLNVIKEVLLAGADISTDQQS